MTRWCIAFVLVIAACSSDDGASLQGGASGDAAAAASGGSGGAGASGGSTGSGATAGTKPDAAEVPDGAAGTAGAAPGPGGAAGATGGGTSGAAGAEDVPEAGAGTDGGPVDSATSEAAIDAGADPCAGVAPWDPGESWTAYEVGELRTLSGALWRCQSPSFCNSYPGSSSSPGWSRVATCAEADAGGAPACQCSTGACCDGCYWRPASYFCGEFVYSSRCTGTASSACPGYPRRIEREYRNLFCSGDQDECTRWHTTASRIVSAECPTSPLSVCVESGQGGDDASCVPCP